MTPEQELCPKCGLKKAVWSHIECCTEGFTEPPCPSCVALRARIEDVEGMAKFMCELSYPATGTGWAGTVESARMAWRERARAVSAWLKEGK